VGDGILCDDGKPCTLDVCQDETCVHLPGELDGTVCKPNSACAADGVCVGDTCESTADITCNDNNICTDDSCDDATGCIYTPNTASCDDEDDCTEEDLCASSTCTGTPIDDCAPNEGTTTLWADADTWLEGTSNVGTHKYLIIGKHGGYPIKRSLLRFDTSSLPTGTALQSAELRIYYNYAHASSFNPEEAIDRVIAVHRMLVPWTETGANKNTSDGNSPWNAPLVGLDEVDAEATPAATELWIAADTKQFNSFDITALAQQWIDAPESNFGALLMAQNEAEEGRDMRCFSRNYGDDEALRPHLVLVY
jgi:hypothetical protein